MVDASSHRLISAEEWGTTTSNERVLLSQTIEEKVRVGKLKDLPPDWFTIPADVSAFPMQEFGNYIVSRELKAKLKGISDNPLLPDRNRLVDLQLLQITDGSQVATEKRFVFDIRTAAANGMALQHVYRDGHRTFILIQGPRQELAEAMRTLWVPNYYTSIPITVSPNDQPITAWLASGGEFDSPPQQQAVMFELEERFVYVIGQDTVQDELILFTNALTLSR
ncbi:MAG: hypothetical protein KatS3mg053_2750 [Candidatus Roseilinea sp.]|nr:MAG: hypothetical protein KatS3mg053_2750 [Candidatus Roseilinea sp.]